MKNDREQCQLVDNCFQGQREQPKAKGLALPNSHAAAVSEEIQQCKVPQSMSEYCSLRY